MNLWWRIVCLMGLMALPVRLLAALPAIDLSTDMLGKPLGHDVEYAFDVSGQRTLDEMRNDPDIAWQRNSTDVVSLGFRKQAVWLRFSVRMLDDVSPVWLSINYPLLNQVELFELNKGNLVTQSRAGTAVFDSVGHVRSDRLLFKLDIPQGDRHDVYLRVRSDSSLVLPMAFYTPVSMIDVVMSSATELGLFFGAIISFVLYHMVVLVLFRDRSYQWYVGTTLGVTVALAMLTGALDRYFLPSANPANLRGVPVCISLALWMAMAMTREFLDTATRWPAIDRWLYPVTWITLLPIAITALGGYHAGIVTVALLVPVLVGLSCLVSWRAWRNGYVPAAYLLAGWTAMVLGTALYALRALGVLPSNAFSDHALQFAVVGLLALMALALTARFRLSMDHEAGARRAMMEAIRAANQNLEQEVNARTRELQEENRQLTMAQKSLAMQEGRFATGVMSAGVAHEINNPNNFVNAGAQLYQAKLDMFRRLIHDLLDGDTDSPLYRQFFDRFDVLQARVESVADTSRDISSIVSQLRAAINNDESDAITTSIVDRLKATIETVRPALKDSLLIDQDFVDNPEVFCNAGELSQAFMNILTTFAEYSTPTEKQALLVGSIRDGERLKLYFRPALAARYIREQLAWLEPLLIKQGASVEWELEGGLIIILAIHVE